MFNQLNKKQAYSTYLYVCRCVCGRESKRDVYMY